MPIHSQGKKKKSELIQIASFLMFGQGKSPLPEELPISCSSRLPLSWDHSFPRSKYYYTQFFQPIDTDLGYSAELWYADRTRWTVSASPFDKTCRILQWSEGQDDCSAGSLASHLCWKWLHMEYILFGIYYVLLQLLTNWHSLCSCDGEAPDKSGTVIITFV